MNLSGEPLRPKRHQLWRFLVSVGRLFGWKVDEKTLARLRDLVNTVNPLVNLCSPQALVFKGASGLDVNGFRAKV